jgi:hypothetical protein
VRSTTDAIRAHLVKHLGTLSAISSMADQHGTPASFQILQFDDVPADDALTLSTLGVADKIFRQRDDTTIRHELILAGYRRFPEAELHDLIGRAAVEVLERDTSILLGQVLDLHEPLISMTTAEGLLFYTPVYFPEGLSRCRGMSPDAVFAWIIPLWRREIDLIAQHGPEALVALLEKHDPDLLDFERGSLVP